MRWLLVGIHVFLLGTTVALSAPADRHPSDKPRVVRTGITTIAEINQDDASGSSILEYEVVTIQGIVQVGGGVIDPLDESVVELQGRGKRVTIKGESDVVLADLIIGRSYEDKDRPGFYLVRVPGQKRVYGSRINIDISTN